MDAKTFALMVQDGVHPVIEFAARAMDFEWCIEPKMRATVIGMKCSLIPHLFEVEVDLEGFHEYNEDLMSRSYYDVNGEPCLTAKEFGDWPKTETLFVNDDDDMDGYLTVLHPNRLQVYAAYLKSGQEVPYTEWMEQRLIECRCVNLK